MLRGRPEPGSDQQGAELVAVQPRPADVRGGRMIEEFFLDGVAVEPRDGAQPAGDGGPGTATGFQVAGEALNIGAACLEQSKMMLLAPARVLAQVQLVRGAGQAAVPGEEPS